MLVDFTGKVAAVTGAAGGLIGAAFHLSVDGVNALRDQARSQLPPDERRLLFGSGDAS